MIDFCVFLVTIGEGRVLRPKSTLLVRLLSSATGVAEEKEKVQEELPGSK